jgi:hypothetical protein
MNNSEDHIKPLIDSHNQSVSSKTFVQPTGPCPKCYSELAKFRVHEYRKRPLLYIVDVFVYHAIAVFIRWKCSVCNKTFIEYPPFALPNKQYISINIEQLCKKYIEDPLSTYRKIAPNIGYQNDAPTVIDERQLSHSTLWRWIPCLEQMSQNLANLLNLTCKQLFDHPFFSNNIQYAIPARKYRTQNRKDTLQAVKIFFWIKNKCERTFCLPSEKAYK